MHIYEYLYTRHHSFLAVSVYAVYHAVAVMIGEKLCLLGVFSPIRT